MKTSNGDAVDGGSGSFASGKQPLRGLTFVLESVDKKKLEEKIKILGGTVSKDVGKKTAALITTKEALQKKSKSVKAAIEYKIQVIDYIHFHEDHLNINDRSIQSKILSPRLYQRMFLKRYQKREF